MKKIITLFTIIVLLASSTSSVYADDIVYHGAISRYDFIKKINETFDYESDLKEELSKKKFKDDKAKQFYIANKKGFVQGDFENARFDESITVAEISVVLLITCDLSTYPHPFPENQIPAWASKSIVFSSLAGFFTEEEAVNGYMKPIKEDKLNEIISKISTDKYNIRAKGEIYDYKSFDGYNIETRLYTPSKNLNVDKLVIYVNGSGPNTYHNKRGTKDEPFNYFDLFRDEFAKIETGFISYSTRGVHMGEEPPLFADINEEEYTKYLPSTQVKDLVILLDKIKTDKRFIDTKIYLLGWSEGTSIAPLVALETKGKVDGLLLAGYYHDGLKDILEWQNSGQASMIFYLDMFDLDKKGYVSKDDYEKDPYKVVDSILGGLEFEHLDTNKDDKLEADDIKIALIPLLDGMLKAIKEGDDLWLKENYQVQLTSKWFKEHFAMDNNSETLPKINMPIYIFQGTHDASTPLKEAEKAKDQFEKLGKNNLTVNIFQNHDHDLNYSIYLYYNEVPEGIQSIIDTVDKF